MRIGLMYIIVAHRNCHLVDFRKGKTAKVNNAGFGRSSSYPCLRNRILLLKPKLSPVKTHLFKIVCIILFINVLSGSFAQSLSYDTAWVNRFAREVNSAILANQLDLAGRIIDTYGDTARLRFGERSKEMSDVLEWDINRCVYLDDYVSMVEKAGLNVQIRRETFGAKHVRVAGALIQLAQGMVEMVGYRDTVEHILLDAFRILDDPELKYSDERLNGLNQIALFYQGRGNYIKAESAFLEALQIEQKLYGTSRYEYAILANNIATLYSNLERLPEAVHFYEISLEYTEKVVGRMHPDYCITLKSLGAAYRRWGKFDKAEKSLTEALEIARKVLPPGQTHLALYLWSLADFYSAIGQYKKMGPFVEEAQALVSSKYSLPKPMMITAYIEQSTYLEYMRRYEEAAASSKAILQAMEQSAQTNTETYARVTLNLSRVYFLMNRKTEAQVLVEQAVEQSRKFLDPQSPIFYKRFGQAMLAFSSTPETAQRAREMLNAGLPVLTKNFGPESLIVADWESAGGWIWSVLNNPDSAFYHSGKAFQVLKKRVQEDFAYLSFAQKEAYLTTFNKFFRNMLALGSAYPSRPQTGSFLYDIALFRKELLGMNDGQLLRRWKQLDDPALRVPLSRYGDLRQEVITIESRPLNQQQDLKALKDSIELIEKQLLISTGGSGVNLKNEIVRWQSIQKTLQAGEAALEFLFFPDKASFVSRYGAILLLPGSAPPELIPLGEAALIDSLLSQAGNRPLGYAEKVYGPGNTGRKIYELIWKPIESRLSGKSKVYIAPDGRLCQLNFRALPVPQAGKYLADLHTLVCLTSTRQLLEPGFNQGFSTQAKNALLFGGIDFDHSDAPGVDVTAEHAGSFPASVLSDLSIQMQGDPERGSDRRQWNQLPETLIEVTQIDSLLLTQKIATQMATGKEGTEALLKSRCSGDNAPTILHIATHGFFYAQARPLTETEVERPGFLFSENPMLRSGLVLAGANPAWKGTPRPNEPEDGILTAEEVSFLDLQHTDLVVLSACETGLGEIRDYEGVFGLQRAFRMAGAKNLVMTLWRVPDQTTREFMVDFYGRMSKGATVRAAFNEAVTSLRKKYPAPYYWAGFVLVDGTR